MRITCPNCGFSRDMPEDRIPPAARLATCPKCQHKFRLREEEESFLLEDEAGQKDEQAASAEGGEKTEPEAGPSQAPHGAADRDDIWHRLENMDDLTSDPWAEGRQQTQGREREGGSSEVPWENLDAWGFFPGLFQTVKQVMLTPTEFYRGLSRSGGFSHPTAFYVLIMEVPALALVFWLMSGLFPQAQSEASGLFEIGLTGVGSLTFLLVFPVFMIMNLFISSGLYHLVLLGLGGGAAGFEGTFKVVCYSAAPMVLALVPVFGMWVGGIWQLVCIFVGFRFVHDLSPAKAALPVIVVQLVFVLLLSGTTGLA